MAFVYIKQDALAQSSSSHARSLSFEPSSHAHLSCQSEGFCLSHSVHYHHTRFIIRCAFEPSSTTLLHHLPLPAIASPPTITSLQSPARPNHNANTHPPFHPLCHLQCLQSSPGRHPRRCSTTRPTISRRGRYEQRPAGIYYGKPSLFSLPPIPCPPISIFSSLQLTSHSVLRHRLRRPHDILRLLRDLASSERGHRPHSRRFLPNRKRMVRHRLRFLLRARKHRQPSLSRHRLQRLRRRGS